jgi:hypothetical protein
VLTQYLPAATEGNHKKLKTAAVWFDVWNQDIPNMNQKCYVPERAMHLHGYLRVFSVLWTTSTQVRDTEPRGYVAFIILADVKFQTKSKCHKPVPQLKDICGRIGFPVDGNLNKRITRVQAEGLGDRRTRLCRNHSTVWSQVYVNTERKTSHLKEWRKQNMRHSMHISEIMLNGPF